MVLRKICKDLLEERDIHYKAVLQEKDAQCSKLSREYTELIVKENNNANERLLEQKDLQLNSMVRSNANLFEQNELRLTQAKNFTEHLTNEKDLHLQSTQKAMENKQIAFCVFAVIAVLIIFTLMLVASNEKRRMDQRYESIIKEKSDRIVQLEQEQEEQRKQKKKEVPTATSTGIPQMPAHPFMYALPPMSYSTSPVIQLAEK